MLNKHINYKPKYILIDRIERYNDKEDSKIILNDYLYKYKYIDEVIIYNLGKGNKSKLIINIFNKDDLIKKKVLFYGKYYSLYPNLYESFKNIEIKCIGNYIIEMVKYTENYKNLVMKTKYIKDDK